MLGEYRGGEVAEGVGLLAILTAVLLTVLLQRWQLSLKDQEQQTWWASNGRDLINLGSWFALWGALTLVGFPGPSGAAVAGTLIMYMFLLEKALVTFPHVPLAGVGVLVAALLGASPVFFAPRAVHDLAERAASVLAGR